MLLRAGIRMQITEEGELADLVDGGCDSCLIGGRPVDQRSFTRCRSNGTIRYAQKCNPSVCYQLLTLYRDGNTRHGIIPVAARNLVKCKLLISRALWK